MSHYTRINQASSYFFFAGFVFSKLQRLPLFLLSNILNLISLIMYLVGYTLWFIATLINPDTTKQAPKWYGFAEFKEQSAISAFIGILATILSLIALFFPILLLPAAWLFLCSNIIWTISEYHQLKNPPHNPTYSQSYQENYLSYAMTMSGSSLLSALSITISLLFPPIAIPVLYTSLILSVCLGALALQYWLACSLDNHKPCTINPSYEQISSILGPSVSNDSMHSPAPNPAKPIFANQKNVSKQLLSTGLTKNPTPYVPRLVRGIQ